MDNVYPELDYATAKDIQNEGAIEIVGNNVARVRGKNVRKPICLDFNNPEDKENHPMKTFVCHGTGKSHNWYYTVC